MKKTAVALFEGKAKGESKKGVKMDLDNFNATMIFKKKTISGKWLTPTNLLNRKLRRLSLIALKLKCKKHIKIVSETFTLIDL